MQETPSAWIQWDGESKRLCCGGDWSYAGLPAVLPALTALGRQVTGVLTVDGHALTALDTSGCQLLMRWLTPPHASRQALNLTGFNTRHAHLLRLVEQHQLSGQPTPPAWPNMCYRLGRFTALKGQRALQFLAFVGELMVRLVSTLKHPRQFRFAYFAEGMQASGVYALPLIAFLSLLVGVVLAYQIGLQLRLYGANIFVVNLLSLSVLREFGPLITAIIVAGRSGSAFTAQIGTMVMRQEVDALRTLGLNTLDCLVLPRVVALMVVLPLLTVWADCFAMLGGMLMSQSMLGISFTEFLYRARTEVSLDTYLIGLIKTPVFGFVIACVGCFQGLSVTQSAASIGRQTTKSVVQALFLIIILDAVFSVIFSMSGF